MQNDTENEIGRSLAALDITIQKTATNWRLTTTLIPIPEILGIDPEATLRDFYSM